MIHLTTFCSFQAVAAANRNIMASVINNCTRLVHYRATYFLTRKFSQNSSYDKNSSNRQSITAPCDLIFAKLSSERESLQPNPSELAYFPLSCAGYKPKYFHDSSIVQNWWKALENNLNDLEAQELCNTIRGLGKLNKVMNGRIQNSIGWKQIMLLVENCLKSYSQHSDL